MTLKTNDLLISADGTYPGIVTDHESEYMVRVKWYKWGYNSKDFYHEWEWEKIVLPLLATPADIRKKFWTLPPEYTEVIVTTGEKIAQLMLLAGDISNAEYMLSEEGGTEKDVENAKAALVRFYLEGRE